MNTRIAHRQRIAGLVFMLFYLALMFALHFSAAGTGQLPFSWIALGSFAVISIINVFLAEPELISERLQFGGKRVNQKDQLLASGSFLFLLPIPLMVAGLDCGRYLWTQNYPVTLQISGVIFYNLGNLIFRWAMHSNRYFSTFVRIQEDRGHQVESGGPYQYIRHPGYAGGILSALTLPLALGSLYALAPAFVGCVGLILRTNLEDNQLKSELAGYLDYAGKVRFRLLPGIW